MTLKFLPALAVALLVPRAVRADDAFMNLDRMFGRCTQEREELKKELAAVREDCRHKDPVLDACTSSLAMLARCKRENVENQATKDRIIRDAKLEAVKDCAALGKK